MLWSPKEAKQTANTTFLGSPMIFRRLAFFILTGVFLACSSSEQNSSAAEPDYSAKRNRMVDLIASRGVRDKRVLNAMRKIPRHSFVPSHMRLIAYRDSPLPIGEGQTISQPYIVAYMTEALSLKVSDRVLEIGTGSGYQAAVLAELVNSVFTIEIVPTLGKRASSVLKTLGYPNVTVRIGDGYRGWPEKAPFDAIIITAAPKRIPEPLLEQLNEGGRMILPLGGRSQELILLTKRNGQIIRKNLLPVIFVPMTGEIDKIEDR